MAALRTTSPLHIHFQYGVIFIVCLLSTAECSDRGGRQIGDAAFGCHRGPRWSSPDRLPLSLTWHREVGAELSASPRGHAHALHTRLRDVLPGSSTTVRLNQDNTHRHDVSLSEDSTGIRGGDRGEEREGKGERGRRGRSLLASSSSQQVPSTVAVRGQRQALKEVAQKVQMDDGTVILVVVTQGEL